MTSSSGSSGAKDSPVPTPERNSEVAARAADIRSRLTNDLTTKLNEFLDSTRGQDPVSDQSSELGLRTIVAVTVEEAMFYVEHLLMEIEGE